MSLRVGAGRSLNHLELATDFAADLVAFELHPALLDGALAITAGEGLHLPFSYGRVVVHAALPREIYSFAHFPESGFDADLVSANLVILDAEGRILVEIEDYTLRRMDERRVDEPSPPEVAGELAAGITNREGAEVFRRILGAELSQVIVSTRDLEIQAEESRKLELAKVAEPVPGTSYQRPDLGTPYVAPQSELEKSIAGIWQEVLGIAQVGVEDDFLELGGHSLLATQVLSRLRKVLGLDLPLKSFFEASNVADLVRTVEGLESKADTDTPLVDIKEGML